MEKENYKRLKKFALTFSLGMFILFTIGIIKHFSPIFLVIIALLILYHIIFYFVNPAFLKWSFFIIDGIIRMVGIIITNTLLTIFYYLIFTPIAILLRILKKDEIKKISTIPNWIEISPEENDPKKIEKLY